MTISDIQFFILLFLSPLIFRFLRRYSQALYLKKYGQHLIFEHPAFQVGNKARFNKAMFFTLLTVGVCAALLTPYLLDHVISKEVLFAFAKGVLVTLFTYIIAQRVAAIIVFQHAAAHPEEISGITHFKKALVNKVGFGVTLPAVTLFIIMPFFVPDPFIIGSSVAMVLLLIDQLLKWYIPTIF
ncbi:MAG TPA: hypothetical protein VFF04_04760 [Candidatus Babeliales bacterium]|nr:hypothetical protein [Candidatus Babeliales bacterium]